MAITRAVPRPPPPSVPVVDANGNLTPAWQSWLVELIAFLLDVKAQVP
jgi:hypothetical protein